MIWKIRYTSFIIHSFSSKFSSRRPIFHHKQVNSLDFTKAYKNITHLGKRSRQKYKFLCNIQTLRTETRHKQGSKTPVFELAVILQPNSNVCCHLTRLLRTSNLK